MKRLIQVIAVMIFSAAATAEVYKCKQPDGKTVYQPTPCRELKELGTVEIKNDRSSDAEPTLDNAIKSEQLRQSDEALKERLARESEQRREQQAAIDAELRRKRLADQRECEYYQRKLALWSSGATDPGFVEQAKAGIAQYCKKK